jgi:predicted alpha/beta hydrolase family esterase
MSYVLINHGWTNTRPAGHWQRNAAVELRRQGHQVFYPQYPNTANPNFDEWSSLLNAELNLLLETRAESNDEVIVIGHSLGCVNWLKSAALGLLPEGFVADRVLLVSPPEPVRLIGVPSFSFDPNDPAIKAAFRNAAKQTTVLASDNDVWLPSGIQKVYGEPFGIEPVILPGVKHLSLSEGFSSWLGVINWVNDPAADLTEHGGLTPA